MNTLVHIGEFFKSRARVNAEVPRPTACCKTIEPGACSQQLRY